MRKTLQKIVLPGDERLEAHWQLFYRGPRLVVDGGVLRFADNCTVDFATYLNGFPAAKWREYTRVGGVSLSVRLAGSAVIRLVGYSLNPASPSRTEFCASRVDCAEPSVVELAYPAKALGSQLLSFEVLPLGGCALYSAEFYAEVADDAVRDVTLCIATTTFRKEAFITKNIALIRDELLCEGSDCREHLFVHVVDNGRTLSEDDVRGEHVFLHPNKNVGGSGGFARGMMEALRQEPRATHVLLMDDDVLVLPESIRRTYELLTLLKDEWQDAFVSGAMLEYDAMNVYQGDVGFLTGRGSFKFPKKDIDENMLGNVLRTNLELGNIKNLYASWWLCCVPASQIQRCGLPLPLFFRADDMEFSLRCNPKFITMSGICLWHFGFKNKFAVATDFYQVMRNMLIAKAVSGVAKNADTMGRIRTKFYQQLREFCYDGAESLILVVEDFLKGPAFLESVDGAALFAERSALNEKMQPLEQFGVEVQLGTLYNNPPLPFFKRVLFRLTLNFQRFWPRRLLNGSVSVIAFDWLHQPSRVFRHSRLLAVNPYSMTAALRVQDRSRCRALRRRFSRVMRQYRAHHAQVEQQYAAKKDWLTSEQFWRRYLGLDQ